MPKESERDLRASLQLDSPQGETRARTLLRLAALAFRRGDLKASVSLVDAAEDAYDHNAAYARGLRASVAESRGQIAYLGGHYARAAELFAQAATEYQGVRGDFREDLGRALMSEAGAMVQLKRFAQADALFARSVSLYLARFGMANVLTATAIQNRALNDFERGDFSRAESRVQQALAVYARVLEPNHPRRAAALVLLGRIRTGRNDSAGALAAFDMARSVYAALYGSRNAAVGDVDFYAAEAASRGGDSVGALRLLDQTKSIYDASYGPDDPDQVELLMARARILARGGMHAESARSCSAGLALQFRLDPQDPALPAARQSCLALAQVQAAS